MVGTVLNSFEKASLLNFIVTPAGQRFHPVTKVDKGVITELVPQGFSSPNLQITKPSGETPTQQIYLRFYCPYNNILLRVDYRQIFTRSGFTAALL
ncbi:hypothetical protein BH11BAC3_BH11BAC3_47390 [soil metagenome]